MKFIQSHPTIIKPPRKNKIIKNLAEEGQQYKKIFNEIDKFYEGYESDKEHER